MTQCKTKLLNLTGKNESEYFVNNIYFLLIVQFNILKDENYKLR